MLSSAKILQKLIAKLFISGDKCCFSCCRKRAEEVSIGSWSKRKRLDLFWWQDQDLSHAMAKNICIFQTVSLCLRVAKRKSQENCNVRSN